MRGAGIREEQVQIEIGWDFDVLWTTYNHDQTDVQYLALLPGSAIAAAELRIGTATSFNRTLVEQETALSGCRR
ncbi:hypothetical protein [Bradyrhizobium sp. NBAIM01]|uniref:hypothetical protein n=1 Tax=Bradyrhizobium sp. NBAIM01 TaxID=2793818 RepID=UPI001CD3BFDB|nr:hypothetical protein [Bradyrhizobium sp. NBAIM01]MCA1510271.1 hypothetical protein [Bradyrhizobium sp. NBAIM01]